VLAQSVEVKAARLVQAGLNEVGWALHHLLRVNVKNSGSIS